MLLNTIGVCGAGTMGSGIAQVMATAGYPTILYELSEEIIQNSKLKIQNNLQRLADKQKITTIEMQAIFQRITFTSDLQQCIGDIIIEAIIEKAEAKIALFNQLSLINSGKTIFATNTSSLSITQLAQQIKNPERIAGLHFFNPAPVMKLVEVVKGEQTASAIIETLIMLVKRLGKAPVVCKDAPGFIVNRVARPYYIESLRLAEENFSNFETIDRLLEVRGFKMGPFKLMDLIGNDVNYAVSCSVYEQLQRPDRLKPSSLQKEKVAQHHLGKKTGKGYYLY